MTGLRAFRGLVLPFKAQTAKPRGNAVCVPTTETKPQGCQQVIPPGQRSGPAVWRFKPVDSHLLQPGTAGSWLASAAQGGGPATSSRRGGTF